jgi:hypothetical protein
MESIRKHLVVLQTGKRATLKVWLSLIGICDNEAVTDQYPGVRAVQAVERAERTLVTHLWRMWCKGKNGSPCEAQRQWIRAGRSTDGSVGGKDYLHGSPPSLGNLSVLGSACFSFAPIPNPVIGCGGENRMGMPPVISSGTSCLGS